MEENLEGIQRPVYRNLRIIWQVQVIGFVFSFLITFWSRWPALFCLSCGLCRCARWPTYRMGWRAHTVC